MCLCSGLYSDPIPAVCDISKSSMTELEYSFSGPLWEFQSDCVAGVEVLPIPRGSSDVRISVIRLLCGLRLLSFKV